MLHIPRSHSEPCRARDIDEIRWSDPTMIHRAIQHDHIYYSASGPWTQSLNTSQDGTSSIRYLQSVPFAASHAVPFGDDHTNISSAFENLGLEDVITAAGESLQMSQRKGPLWKKVLKAPYKGAKYVVKKWMNPSPECMRCVQMTSWIVVIISAIIGTVVTLVKIC